MAGEPPSEVLAQVLERLAREAREGRFAAAAVVIAGIDGAPNAATAVCAGEVTQFKRGLMRGRHLLATEAGIMERAWLRVPQGPLI